MHACSAFSPVRPYVCTVLTDAQLWRPKAKALTVRDAELPTEDRITCLSLTLHRNGGFLPCGFHQRLVYIPWHSHSYVK